MRGENLYSLENPPDAERSRKTVVPGRKCVWLQENGVPRKKYVEIK
jgi:hypothetical protein